MTIAFLIAVRFYQGRYHGSEDWPPAPNRLFQALVAGAAVGARLPAAVSTALDWLESQEPPTIVAPYGKSGQTVQMYVPNNDVDAKLGKSTELALEHAVSEIRVEKQIRPILFDEEQPVLYCWLLNASEKENASKISEIAERMFQLGLGIDMAWTQCKIMSNYEAINCLERHGGAIYQPSKIRDSNTKLNCYRPGTRRSLENRFKRTMSRFHISDESNKCKLIFKQPPKPLFVNVAYNANPFRFVFDLRGNDANSNFKPRPLSESANLIIEIRDKVAERLCENVPELAKNVERYLIGRGATDFEKEMRVRIVPIPSIGHDHVDMNVRRIAVYVPQTCPLSIKDLEWALTQVYWTDADGVIQLGLQQAESLRMINRFEIPSRKWRSVTPVVLQSAPRRRISPEKKTEEAKDGKERIDEEIHAITAVHQALRHAGIQKSVSDISLQREPFDRKGRRAESFATDTRFSKQAFWHLEITFSGLISGPLLLGDGRYLGLGFMQPIESVQGVDVFVINGGLESNAQSATVAQAARRAMMARMQDTLARGQRLPGYVSGHEVEGTPSRKGNVHRHIAVIADLPRRRILFMAPTLLHRTGINWRDIRDEHKKVSRALEDMTILRAGAAGCLSLNATTIDLNGDPLFAPARVWESVTDYQVTCHPRRLNNEEALKMDVTCELQRRGWPSPENIDVLQCRSGPRGGLFGRLRLTFATAQAGPLVIGRSTHKGGGLFING